MQKICWSIKYLSGPLGHKIYRIWAARSCSVSGRHPEILDTFWNYIVIFSASILCFALFRVERTWWDVGEDNRQCFTTSRHWEHPEEAPSLPTPCNMDCKAIFFLPILTFLDHVLNLCPFVSCKTFYAKWKLKKSPRQSFVMKQAGRAWTIQWPLVEKPGWSQGEAVGAKK